MHPVDICRLVLPHHERAGLWLEALALPHVTPSAECFTRGIMLECDEDIWLQVADAWSEDDRLFERRNSAIKRWRAPLDSEDKLRDAVRPVLLLRENAIENERDQNEIFEKKAMKARRTIK